MIRELIKDRRVLFVTTKNLDYIRNTQEISIIENCAVKSRIIGFTDKSYARRLVKVYLGLLRERKRDYDVIFIGFAPQLVLPFWHGKFRKHLVVIDFFISLYDTLVCDRQLIGKNSLPAKLLHYIDERTIKCADYILADTRAHGAYFASEFAADPEKTEVLYLEADRTIYYPREQKKDVYADLFLVLYFGSILPLQGVETVLEAAEILKAENKIHFIVIGPVRKETKRYEGDHIEYIDWLSQSELAERIAMADLCLAGHFNAHIDKAKRTIPGKAYIYEAMGKKMILGDNSANRELFAADDRHYYVEMGNAAKLAEQIIKLAEM